MECNSVLLNVKLLLHVTFVMLPSWFESSVPSQNREHNENQHTEKHGYELVLVSIVQTMSSLVTRKVCSLLQSSQNVLQVMMTTAYIRYMPKISMDSSKRK